MCFCNSHAGFRLQAGDCNSALEKVLSFDDFLLPGLLISPGPCGFYVYRTVSILVLKNI